MTRSLYGKKTNDSNVNMMVLISIGFHSLSRRRFFGAPWVGLVALMVVFKLGSFVSVTF
ncbi:hypothetical protein RchiOBHm_Chr6g0281191 [Rosa chinensis]|uniref:Uncharacterized protein n=1 Tax=Rosa chinensis TaxID=74649 RepID=A0A2P6PTF3_ROSCH|nr:hypothetical protein RchiOBHm_Chr6g0281191 [Rosa chinensis]